MGEVERIVFKKVYFGRPLIFGLVFGVVLGLIISGLLAIVYFGITNQGMISIPNPLGLDGSNIEIQLITGKPRLCCGAVRV